MIPAAVHRFAWAGTAVAAVAVCLAAAAAEGRGPWEGWEASRELRRPGYAERVLADRPIRTRANTFSNLAYVTAGLYACAFALADRRAPRRQDAGGDRDTVASSPVLSMLFGLSAVWLGFSSGLFHASLTRAGQRLDVAAMYPPLLSLLAIAAARRLPARVFGPRGIPTPAILAAIVVAAGACLWKWKWSMSATTTLLGLIGAVSVVAVAEHLATPGRFRAGWLAVAALCLVAGIVCRQTDVAGTFPVGPDSWFQGHALWHVLTAAALLAMYFRGRPECGAVTASTSGTPR